MSDDVLYDREVCDGTTLRVVRAGDVIFVNYINDYGYGEPEEEKAAEIHVDDLGNLLDALTEAKRRLEASDGT